MYLMEKRDKTHKNDYTVIKKGDKYLKIAVASHTEAWIEIFLTPCFY